MQLGRLSSISCGACRSTVIRSFVSLTGAAETGTTTASRFAIASRPRQFSTSIQHRNDGEDSAKRKEVIEEEKDSITPLRPEGESLPWYLQNQTPRTVPSEIAERQRIPDLPVNPPTILPDLLQYVSVDLGLDDLTLLDLREMDPPAALGANLIMVLGTARSEKHLHVSADRCCRWLRANHKLRPFADGLLGRNELKLRLRRQAKKAKLLRSVGAPTADSLSEELRPGWICVNIGQVEGGALEVKKRDIVGFDESTKGTMLVVQMMTEDRRKALDLEGLWTKALNRQKKQQQETEASTAPLNLHPTPSLSMIMSQRFEYENPFIPLEQTLKEEMRTSAYPQTGQLSEEQAMERWHEIQVLPDHTLTFGQENPISSRLLNNLRQMPLNEARTALGKGPDDFWSTPFLTEFYQSLSSFSTPADWACRIALVSYAAEIGHEEYDAKAVFELYKEAVESGMLINNDIYVVTLRALFAGTNPEPWQLFAVLDILQSMSYSGMDIFSNELFLSLFLLLEKLPTLRSKRSPHTSVLKLHDLMRTAVTFPPSNSIVQHLLVYFARHRLWDRFWLTWRDCALQHKRRDSQIYQLLFDTVAADGSASHIRRALSDCFEEMEREAPPVEWTPGLLAGIRSCVFTIVPNVQELAQLSQAELEEQHFEDPQTAYWVLIWKICGHAERENWHSTVPLPARHAPAQIGSVSSRQQPEHGFSEPSMNEFLVQG